MNKIALSILALGLLAASCKNTPSASQGADGTPAESNTISNVEPSSDFAALNEQVMADLIAARKYSRQFSADYDESLDVIRNKKLSLANMSDSEREHAMKAVADGTDFRLLYEEHRGYTDMLDSISIRLVDGSLGITDAQTYYKGVREKLRSAQGKLEGARKRYLEIKD